ncbi:hypothetical protein FIBSPDRAFT_889198 [Athelia psychrophila]|uniref:F-box domain-containing protein n=1 Tax=Athelia psychrophila TaxID=1759441 RepID=A0A166MFZ0_9AGAM|nr:hypothetical protein FIBSPDRAFT_889198 [Fibularhizoctonia sp. CBS 109695]
MVPVRDGQYGYTWQKAQPMFQVLIASCALWRHLHVNLIPPALIAPIKNNLPNLQQLYLYGISDHNALDIFANAPQLSYLAYNVSRPLVGQHTLLLLQPFQWKQLRRLDCRIHLETGQDLWILSLTPNVQTAYISVTSGSKSTAQVVVPRGVHMPNLTHLRIDYHHHSDPSALLEALFAPALASLEIAIILGADHSVNCGLAFTSLVSQATSLRRLVIHFDPVFLFGISGSDLVIDLLKNTPKLNELHIHCCKSDTLGVNFIDAFTVPDENATSSTVFLPALTSISLIDYAASGKYAINMLAFIDALQSRASQGLRHVLLSQDRPNYYQPTQRFYSYREEDPALLKKLRQLRDQGLDIRFLVQGRDFLD